MGNKALDLRFEGLLCWWFSCWITVLPREFGNRVSCSSSVGRWGLNKRVHRLYMNATSRETVHTRYRQKPDVIAKNFIRRNIGTSQKFHQKSSLKFVPIQERGMDVGKKMLGHVLICGIENHVCPVLGNWSQGKEGNGIHSSACPRAWTKSVTFKQNLESQTDQFCLHGIAEKAPSIAQCRNTSCWC